MATYSYFPGCTLKNKAADLDRFARESAKALGIELEEVPNWQCCGGVYPLSKDEIVTRLSSARALSYSHSMGNDLVTLCSACHNVIKQVNNDMRNDEHIRQRVKNYLGVEFEYNGEVNVIHYLELLRDAVGFDKLRDCVVKPFSGVRIGAFYGCLLLRPSKIMKFDDPENPHIIEDFIRAIGGEPVIYANRNECCGGYMTLEDKSLAEKSAAGIMNNARANSADMLITACPLCLYNLTQNTKDGIPVKYFTELLYEALGLCE